METTRPLRGAGRSKGKGVRGMDLEYWVGQFLFQFGATLAALCAFNIFFS